MSKDNIINLDSFRQNREDQAKPHGGDPAFEVFHDILSIPAISPENMPAMMQNLLRSLNSQFAIAAQKTALPEGAGMYNAHIPVTNLNFKGEAIEEIAADFSETLQKENPRAYFRLKQRVDKEYERSSDEGRTMALKLRFKIEAVGHTPAYRNLVGQMKKVFPDAAFKPSMIEIAENAFRPCLQIDTPIKEGQDLRAQITAYLGNKSGKPNLRPI
jgi:hypothetical protein